MLLKYFEKDNAVQGDNTAVKIRNSQKANTYGYENPPRVFYVINIVYYKRKIILVKQLFI